MSDPDVRNSLGRGFISDWADEIALPATGENGAMTDADRVRRIMQDDFALERTVFNGERLPGVSRAASENLERLVGPHQVAVTYYDRDYNPVTEAAAPGRYGAVVEVAPTSGRVLRRYHTLYRAPEAFAWFRSFVPAAIELPPALGVDPGVAAAQSETLAVVLRDLFAASLRRGEDGAILLAGLSETPTNAEKATAADDVWARDRQWWVGLKRRLAGLDRLIPEPFVAPVPETGSPAPTLRQGTETEAGMVPGTSEKLDTLLRTWADDSDQAFAVCVARRGIVFLHRAYGERDGRPMTTDTPSWMASISKLLAGTLLLLLLDQGRVALDTPVDDYLPWLRDIPVERPLTLRLLMTHTGGFWEHWGDEQNDFEERVADGYPVLEVGQRFEYNGASFALAGKIIEAVSGEALPQAFRNHLLAPLDMARTDIRNMSWGTISTPGEMARLGQMLLNRGAYGDQRFFRPESLSLLLPPRSARALSTDAADKYGLGVTWFTDEGLGAGTFGHGAASGATLRIDPANELVVVMTRNAVGANFDTYHPQFLQIIGEGVASG